MACVSCCPSSIHLPPLGGQDLKLSPEANASLPVRSGVRAQAELVLGRERGMCGWAPLRVSLASLLGMAGRVSLKRGFSTGRLEMPSRLELQAALDLKSAHGPDHSGRGVSSLEPQCKSHRPLSGLGLWCPALGLVGPTNLVLKPPPEMLAPSASLFVTSHVMVVGHCQQAKLFSFPSARSPEDSCSLLGMGVGTECPALASLQACRPGLGKSAQPLLET